MPQFILKIDLGGLPRSKKELGYSLFGVASSLYEGNASKGDVYDRNGNVVGHYEVMD